MSNPSSVRPSISVVIPVYDNIENLRRCLAALAQADPPPDEVIVVADGTADGGDQLAEVLGARVIRTPVRRGSAHARNLGARAAQGEIVFFIDSDVVARPNAVGQVAAIFDKDPGLAALFGSYDDAPAMTDFLSQYKNLLHHYVHQTSHEEASTFWSGCGAIRHGVFLAVGGFDEGYSRPAIEDIELGYRLKEAGHRIQLCKALQVKHLKRWEAGSLLRADFVFRALPWTELILRYRRFINDLNLRTSSRISVVLVYGLLAALFGAWWWRGFLVPVGLAALLLLVLNASFYHFLLQKRGPWFVLRAIPWHWFYYFYSGLAFAVGVGRYLLNGLKSCWSRSTQPPRKTALRGRGARGIVTRQPSVVIIGAGPAGLTAAYESTRRGFHPIVLEKSDGVGGLSRTEVYRGYHFDIGGHRFYTQLEEIQQLWQEMLGGQFIKVPRLSHIYYRGRFFHYPLDFFDTLFNLGLIESLLAALSYLRSQFWPYPAAQRIEGLSLRTAVTNALFGNNGVKSLVNEFYYPTLGSGMMWQRFRELVEGRDGKVWLGAEVVRLERDGERIVRVVVGQNGETHTFMGDHVISSMPLTELITRLDPPPPDDVVCAARGLSYRDFILVGLIINREEVLRDNWLYVHSPEVKVGRIQNYKNWSAAMVPDLGKTSLGMEYFCAEGDALWCMSDADLVALATQEIVELGLAEASEVEDGVVIRQSKAYPVYDGEYTAHLAAIRRFLATVGNLQVIGRNGMHRYNNQDHSMLTGLLAVENLLGQNHDLWGVNVERAYSEELAT